MRVYKLPNSSTNYVYLRFELRAKNPYCSMNAIDGTLTMQISKDGWWRFHSGDHRLMPNHHIFIYNSGRVTDAYRRAYQNPFCLVAQLCETADLQGWSGTFG
jgi:hypothetical protein